VDPDGKTPWPVAAVFKTGTRQIISGMYRNNPPTKFHGGVDIIHSTGGRGMEGAPITATHGGTVTVSRTSETAGNWVQITNGDIRTSYMHMQEPSSLKSGDIVNENDFIGNIGTTGRSEGNHLHYQIEMYNTETQKWDKINPVIGNTEHVTTNMKVDLKDPQIYIDYRDGKSPRIPLKSIEVKSSSNSMDMKNPIE
jgi:murein DD-endopeptidase MepM/ murein hydrolase activator NlpD